VEGIGTPLASTIYLRAMSALRVHTILSGGLMLLVASGCGERCKERDIISVPYPAALHKYFNVYQPGNWWVYENSTGLTDSVHVTEYAEEEVVVTNLKPCYSRPKRTMRLNTSQMTDGAPLYLMYQVSTAYSSGFYVMPTSIYSSGSGLGYGTDQYGGNSRMYADSTILGNQYHDLISVDIYGPHGIPGVVMKAFIVAQNIGIIQFTTASDTFNLVQSNLR